MIARWLPICRADAHLDVEKVRRISSQAGGTDPPLGLQKASVSLSSLSWTKYVPPRSRKFANVGKA